MRRGRRVQVVVKTPACSPKRLSLTAANASSTASTRRDQDRPEDLLARQPWRRRVRRRARSGRTAAPSAYRRRAPWRRRRPPRRPSLDPDRGGLVDSGPTSVASSRGSPVTSAATLSTICVENAVVDRAVDEHPLDRDAGLAGLVVGEGRDPRRGPVEVGLGGVVGADDRRRVAAELEGDVLARRRVPDREADRPRAGEGDHRQPLVGDQARRMPRWGPGGPTTCPAGRSVSASSSPSSRAVSGVAGRRLDDDRGADRERRARPCARPGSAGS